MQASYAYDEADNFEGVHILDDDGHQLSILRALRFDEQDRALGQDTYALVQEGGATVYAGIEEWVRDQDGHAVIFLTPQAQEILDSEFDHYAFELPEDQMDMVQNTVGRFVLEAGGKAVDTRPPL